MSTRTVNDGELKIEGIEALNKAMGPYKAFRFLALINREPTDYTHVSRRLYQNQTVEEIYERANTNWSRQ